MAQEIGKSESFSVVYDGALASLGQLHFYEYSRASYAIARMVATVENFRRTGEIADRINTRAYVDVIIKAPERGSFPIDIIIPFKEAFTQFKDLTGIPVGTFVEYIIHQISKLRPKQESDLLALAKNELSKSKEETKRIVEIRKMVESQSVIATTALELVAKAMQNPDQRLQGSGIDQASLATIEKSIRERMQREQAFEPFREQLETIPEAKLIRLTRKVRPQIAEAGLPLRKSAESMRFAQGPDRHVFATLDSADVAEIAAQEIDQESSLALLRFIVYDRDQGTGKCDIVNLRMHRISFSLPINLRRRLKRRVIDALDHDAEQASVRYVRNRDKTITGLIIVDMLTDEDSGAE